MANNGRDLGLLCATDIFFSGYFYSMHCCLRCGQPLKATVHRAPWSDLKNKKATVFMAGADVDSNLYWRKLYFILRIMFPALLTLRLANSSKSAMDKIYYYFHKATPTINNNADNLNNPRFFHQQKRTMAKMSIITRNLPPRSPTSTRLWAMEMTWMVMTSAATRRIMQRENCILLKINTHKFISGLCCKIIF